MIGDPGAVVVSLAVCIPLSTFLGRLSHERRDQPRLGVWCKVGLCLALTLASTLLCKLVVAAELGSGAWLKLFYLPWLLVPGFLGLWSGVLLPRQTRALGRAAMRNPGSAALLLLALLVYAAAFFVSCADLAFEWPATSAVSAALQDEMIWRRAWATNTLILFAAYALVLAVTGRIRVPLLMVSPLYIVFVLASLAKIKYMQVAVYPLDFVRIPEFMHFFRTFFGTGAVVASLFALGIWLAGVVMVARKSQPRLGARVRVLIGIPTLVILVAFPVAFSRVPVASSSWLLRLAGAPPWAYKEHARQHGFLLSFLSGLPAAFIATPANYSREAVADAMMRYPQSGGVPPATAAPVNLVIYLVESLMDPDDLGLHYTSDPIPTIHSLRRTFPGGWAIVPESFGGSANTEFEALTGMTMCSLPEWSVPYRQYLRHSIPSLPSTLKASGYTSTAVQADPKYFFGRERAYELLGFDRVTWLNEAPGVERAPRGANPPSDAAVVEAIVQASQRAKPFFIFAFPTSTHSPYDQRTYQNSTLDVLDAPATDTRGEAKEYVNALAVADRAIAKLIEHFSRRGSDPTVVAILGDHLPPLSWAVRGTISRQLDGLPPAERTRRYRRVPLVIWANFDLRKEDVELSTNALPSYLMAKLHISPSRFLAVSDAVRREMPVLGEYDSECNWGIPQDSHDHQVLLDDYRLIQYQLLLGN
jgi:phosphoglycerol transferase MdoB-like AlkP superfamily enzyme